MRGTRKLRTRGDSAWERGTRSKSCFGIPAGGKLARTQSSCWMTTLERSWGGVGGKPATRLEITPEGPAGWERTMRGGRFTQSQRAKGGWFQKGVTGWRPESPLALPTQGADRWRRLRPLHPRCQEQLSTRRVWVSELSLGCSILEGRLGVGEGGGTTTTTRPRPRPQVSPSGEGVISARRSRKREAGEGAAALLLPPPFLGRGKWIRPGPFPRPGPTRSGSSGSGSRRERRDWAGGDTWAVAPRLRGGGGAARWSPGHAAERGMHRTRNPGMPGSTRGHRLSSGGGLGLRQGVSESAARGPGRSPPARPHRGEGGRRHPPPPPHPRKRDVP